jgi:phasin
MLTKNLTPSLGFPSDHPPLARDRVNRRVAAQNYVALQQKLVYKAADSIGRADGRQARPIMPNPPFEIPNELRDFAERSVDQARKAFEGFVSVAQKAIGAADNAAEAAQQNAKSVGAQALSFTEQNVNAALELAHKLVQAKDPQAAFALQSEFLKTQLASLQSQAREIGAQIQKNATPGAK